jgi:succinyl-CoA synthetase alpha subunit
LTILADQNVRVIVQGITGREASTFTKDMMDYGTHVVAGVTPGKLGQTVHGVAVYDTVRQALKEHPAEASVISVPPALVKDAVIEALDNGIKLVVVISERVPRKDTIEFLEIANENNARVIGPNTLGLISPEKIKLGMAGGPVGDVKKAYMPGCVGIASRSGGMTTEVANLLTANGIGQSTCIGIGGDPVVGSNFLDLIPLFENDPETKVVVLFSEPGGVIEEKLCAVDLWMICRGLDSAMPPPSLKETVEPQRAKYRCSTKPVSGWPSHFRILCGLPENISTLDAMKPFLSEVKKN